jgi:hypothetical protein
LIIILGGVVEEGFGSKKDSVASTLSLHDENAVVCAGHFADTK